MLPVALADLVRGIEDVDVLADKEFPVNFERKKRVLWRTRL